jgi:hypothetical protein
MEPSRVFWDTYHQSLHRFSPRTQYFPVMSGLVWAGSAGCERVSAFVRQLVSAGVPKHVRLRLALQDTLQTSSIVVRKRPLDTRENTAPCFARQGVQSPSRWTCERAEGRHCAADPADHPIICEESEPVAF